jgi:hypothetical protein
MVVVLIVAMTGAAINLAFNIGKEDVKVEPL